MKVSQEEQVHEMDIDHNKLQNSIDSIVIPCSRHLQTSLAYEIDSWSTYTANYHPRNIMIDKPTDQSSRWSSGSRDQHQFLLLRFNKPVILQAITFGKYHMPHVCNLKEFRILVGLDPDHLYEVLHAGLRNDTEQETFPTKYQRESTVLPCLFVKIIPLMAWGASFNYGVWYVDLRGLSYDSGYVQSALNHFELVRKAKAIRIIEKFFRYTPSLVDLVPVLVNRTNVPLEDSMVTRLYHSIFQSTYSSPLDIFLPVEQILDEAEKLGYFNNYTQSIPYKSKWINILSHNPQDKSRPSPRGGHQMILDTQRDKIYLFGGWNGSSDLGDLWSFDLTSNKWHCITQDARSQNGPCPRSVHKMVLYSKKSRIYTLGRFIDPTTMNLSDTKKSLPSPDFYYYDIESSNWTLVSSNTKLDNGPDLIYDHQMVIDEQNDTIYVFGGKSVRSTTSEPVFSCLYSYSIPNNKWTLIRSDSSQPASSPKLRSRIGHSMLFDSTKRKLYIFSGQKCRDLLADFYTWDLDCDTVIDLTLDMSLQGGPEASFTQRSTLDSNQEELYFLCGQSPSMTPVISQSSSNNVIISADDGMKQKVFDSDDISENDESKEISTIDPSIAHTTNQKNRIWILNLKQDDKKSKWHRAFPQEQKSIEPSIRYAHQFVYDPKRKVHHLFGGNVGDNWAAFVQSSDSIESHEDYSNNQLSSNTLNHQIRLNDHWILKLTRPTSKQVLQKAKFYLKRQIFFLLLQERKEKPSFILKYLQNEVKQVVNLEDMIEREDFQTLPQLLLKNEAMPEKQNNKDWAMESLFERLLDFFPNEMRQPKCQLEDLVSL